jgi:hypothetical protein
MYCLDIALISEPYKIFPGGMSAPLVITNLLLNFSLPVYNSKNKAKRRRRILTPVKKIKFLNYLVSDGKKEKDDAKIKK